MWNAQKYKPTWEIKVIEREIVETKGKILAPVTTLDLLDDSVVESAFPNIQKLLCLYVLIPQSEAVVESGFSKMKLIMNDKRTRLEPESLDSLMRISYNSEPLSSEEVNTIINVWKTSRSCNIFSEGF